MFFRNKKKAEAISDEKSTRYIPEAPAPHSFNFLETESWSGDFAVPSVRMSVVLAYSDWCILQKSQFYRDFELFLLELKKRDKQKRSEQNE